MAGKKRADKTHHHQLNQEKRSTHLIRLDDVFAGLWIIVRLIKENTATKALLMDDLNDKVGKGVK